MVETYELRYIKDPEAFKSKFRDAFSQIVEDNKFTRLLGRFRYAYEYKSQFSWLAESGNFGEDGLYNALENAIVTHRWRNQSQRPEGFRALDLKFERDLLSAAYRFSEDPIRMDMFAGSCAPCEFGLVDVENPDVVDGVVFDTRFVRVEDPQPRYGLPKDPNEMSIFQIRKEIAMSLLSYWKNVKRGLAMP